MSEKHITRVSLEEGRRRRSKTDWEKFDAGDVEDTDDGGFVPDWSTLKVVVPERKQSVKQSVTLRVDNDVLDFFKSGGKGYQTRMNAVLRAYMEAAKDRQYCFPAG